MYLYIFISLHSYSYQFISTFILFMALRPVKRTSVIRQIHPGSCLWYRSFEIPGAGFRTDLWDLFIDIHVELYVYICIYVRIYVQICISYIHVCQYVCVYIYMYKNKKRNEMKPQWNVCTPYPMKWNHNMYFKHCDEIDVLQLDHQKPPSVDVVWSVWPWCVG